VTLWPEVASAIAVASPPRPAPTTMIFRGTLGGWESFAVVREEFRKARQLLGYVGGCWILVNIWEP
jgi:hypothetical protein